MLGVQRRQAVFVDQHGLLGLPFRPGFATDVIEDAAAQRARPWCEIQTLGFALLFFTEDGSAYPRMIPPWVPTIPDPAIRSAGERAGACQPHRAR